MCGALGALDGQSICEHSLDSVWVPQRPRCMYSQSMGTVRRKVMKCSKLNGKYHSIADDLPVPKIYFFIKIGRWPF